MVKSSVYGEWAREAKSKLASYEHPEDRAIDGYIREKIKRADADVRQRHPWMKHVNAIAYALLGSLVASMGATVYAYHTGLMGGVVASLLMTFLLSTLHEMEHDLFHVAYLGPAGSFRFEMAMWCVHLFKVHVSPWWRMKMHLLHHSVSGQKYDIEERLIGLGMPFGLNRLLVTLTPLAVLSSTLPGVVRDNPQFKWWEIYLESKVQLTLLGSGLMGMPLLFGYPAFFGLVSVSAPMEALLRTIAVCGFVPTHIRHICITVMTTFCHYYGDIRPGVVHEQVEILDPWWLLPFQLGCWNFGSSHWIHHFYVPQPFWQRVATAAIVNPQAKSGEWEHSIRHNDFRLFDANRRHQPTREEAPVHEEVLKVKPVPANDSDTDKLASSSDSDSDSDDDILPVA